MAQGPGWVPHLLTFQEQGLQRDDPPETTPIYTPDQTGTRGPPYTPKPASTSTSSTTSASQGG